MSDMTGDWQPAILKHPNNYCPIHKKKNQEAYDRAAASAGTPIRVRLGGGLILGWDKGECSICELHPEDVAHIWPDRVGWSCAMHSCQLDTD